MTAPLFPGPTISKRYTTLLDATLSLPLSAAALGILAAFITPGQLLMVSLSAYFLLLIIRYLSPRVDDSLTWRLDPLSSTTVKEWK
ncbi:hypothetical protein [Corynebacterium macginleyi]|uniref:hypothetical protein n=1 Tax=Corynebacterium macginleyi TaxID=38290 RepID=UPI001F2CE73F|nr:hypothetical protein [Corynebacterium macginleyi]